jgi:hypothetical protein
MAERPRRRPYRGGVMRARAWEFARTLGYSVNRGEGKGRGFRRTPALRNSLRCLSASNLRLNLCGSQ